MNDPMSKIIAMATLAIQQGKSLEISIVDKQDESEQTDKSNGLDQAVKEQIFQTVLENANRNTSLLPEQLADSLIRAYKQIYQADDKEKIGRVGATPSNFG